MWPLTALVPAAVAMGWWGAGLPRPWLGPALAGLALIYMAVGQGLGRLRAGYKLPWHVAAFFVAMGGVLIGLESETARLSAVWLAVVMLAVQALIYRRWQFTALAAVAFIVPFQLSLLHWGVPDYAFPLAYALAASLVYIPLGLWRRRSQSVSALPLFAVGYALAAGAVAASATVLRHPPARLLWLTVATPLVAAGLMVVSANRLKRPPFAWAAVAALTIALLTSLWVLRLPSTFEAAAWVALAAAYGVTERWLARGRLPTCHWLTAFRLPLGLGAAALWAAGVYLTVFATASAFEAGRAANPAGLVAAQALAAASAVLAARLYRNHWLMFLEPVLAFSAVSLAVLGYGELLLGRPVLLSTLALAWTALAGVHLAAAAAIDSRPTRYAHALYVAGYGLLALALVWSLPDRLTNVIVLGVLCAAMLASQVWVHRGWHRSFTDLLELTGFSFVPDRPGQREERGARTLFLFVATYTFPFLLVQALAYAGVTIPGRGLGLAILAPVFIAAGLGVRRLKPEYTWPLYSAGYALTVAGAVLAAPNEALFVTVLALDALVYAASALVFSQPFWLYLSTVLAPVIGLFVLHLKGRLGASWVAALLMVIAFIYSGAGRLIQQRRPATSVRASFALPFLAPAYLLSVLALAAGSFIRSLALVIYPTGMVLYALSAWAYRRTIFLYAMVLLAPLPYFLLLTLLPIEPRWYGLGLLPFIALSLGLGRLVFHRRPLTGEGIFNPLDHPAMPFYLLAYGLSLGAVLASLVNVLALSLTALSVTGLYFFSGVIFRRPGWFYPALLVGHMALLAAMGIAPSTGPVYAISVPFHALTWVIALVGLAISRLAPGAPAAAEAGGPVPVLKTLWAHATRSAWAAPFFLVAAVDVVAWQAVASQGVQTGLIVAAGNGLLLGLVALVWLEPLLAYGALAGLALAAGFGLSLLGLREGQLFAALAGLGFAFYLAARLAHALRRVRRLQLWVTPLDHAALFLVIAATFFSLLNIVAYPTAAAGALAAAGAYAVGESYRRRNYRIGYAGVALLLAAWALALVTFEVAQPQWYAIPAGVYLCGVGFVERRIGRKQMALLMESLGLAVLLLTSFAQSLDGGARGVPFFVLLVVEALLAIGWGAARRLKSPFFVGLAASVINVLAQVVLLFAGPSLLIRWLIIGSAGLLIVGLAVYIERQRERIIATTQVWRGVLEQWD
jgi:hypothetical protein